MLWVDLRVLLCSDNVKESRQAIALTASDAQEERTIFLCGPDEKFRFEQHSPCEIEFASASAQTGELGAVADFVLYGRVSEDHATGVDGK